MAKDGIPNTEIYSCETISSCKKKDKKNRKKCIDKSDLNKTEYKGDCSVGVSDDIHCEFKKTKKKKKRKHHDSDDADSATENSIEININCSQVISNTIDIKLKKEKRKKLVDDVINIAERFDDSAYCKAKKHKKKKKDKGKRQSSSENAEDVDAAPAATVTAPSTAVSADLAQERECNTDPEERCNISAVSRSNISTLFSSLHGHIASTTMQSIQELGFTTMTEIQSWAIPPLLDGDDLRGTAKTGSGKTLAFLIPAIELLHRRKFTLKHGTGVLVLSPTRELAMQIHSVAQQLLRHSPTLTACLVTGGADREREAYMLATGASVLIATPGRLLDHMRSSSSFCYEHLACLVLDEADRLLASNFEEPMLQIFKLIPKERQTMLFSATKTPKTNELVKVALRAEFVDIDVTYTKETVTSEKLDQSFVVCPLDQKFLFLVKFLKKHVRKHKLMVFFSSCDAVKYYHELLRAVSLDLLCIHGKQQQDERTKAFKSFISAQFAVLLCTDVAARGWDIPAVDWVLQYDPPDDPSEYIHRVGRTARVDREGRALLLLRKEELQFVELLKQRKVNITEMELNEGKIPQVQEKVEDLVSGDSYLSWWGRQAFKSSIHAYAMHKRKDVFNIYNLDIRKLGKSFGFKEPPFVDLSIEYKKGSEKKLKRRIREGYFNDDDADPDNKKTCNGV